MSSQGHGLMSAVGSALGIAGWITVAVAGVLIEFAAAIFSGIGIGVLTDAASDVNNNGNAGAVAAFSINFVALIINSVALDPPRGNADAVQTPLRWRFAATLIKAYIETVVPMLLLCVIWWGFRKITKSLASPTRFAEPASVRRAQPQDAIDLEEMTHAKTAS